MVSFEFHLFVIVLIKIVLQLLYLFLVVLGLLILHNLHEFIIAGENIVVANKELAFLLTVMGLTVYLVSNKMVEDISDSMRPI